MDFVSSAFHCDQIDELVQFSSVPCQQRRIQEDSLLLTPLCNADVAKKTDYRPQRKLSVAFDDVDDNLSDYKMKKIIHRDVERQRRQETAALCRSLRSLLPSDYVKGRRSMSDHLLVAVNYISQLQKRVEEKKQQRDELKWSSDPTTVINVKSKSFPNCLKESVTVEASRAGVQIAMSTAMSGGVPVSKVLEILFREGLNVVSCISTNLEERLHHVVDSEVGDGTSINPSELRKKLTDLMV